MFRKTSVALAALLVATTAAISPAAHAATKISNGVACTKKNATTKVGTDKYTCTTNPIATGAAAKKLVWVWSGCLEANKIYLSTKSQYETIMAQINAQSSNLVTKLQNLLNTFLTWKESKSYVKDDVVYEVGKTYYIALTSVPADPNKVNNPSANLGTLWAVYKPTATDANIGTLPDANVVIAMKEKNVVEWTANIATIKLYIKKLEAVTNPSATVKSDLKKQNDNVKTFESGIKWANVNIMNIKTLLTSISTQNSQKSTVEIQKSGVDDTKNIRAQSCAKGV